MKTYDHVGAIIDFESGSLGYDETLELFQYLVNTGLAWKLQGSYGRMAQALIDRGLIRAWKKEVVTND
jgi:hypothetical protein